MKCLALEPAGTDSDIFYKCRSSTNQFNELERLGNFYLFQIYFVFGNNVIKQFWD